jgi:Family of unknown function (DUF6461)
MVDYAWVESLEAFCFTAVVGLDRDETVRRLDGDPTSGERRTFEECFWAADGPQWAQVGPVGTAVLVAENNGWRAEESVERLSKGAQVACFFRNVQAVMHFVYAVDSTVLAEFDPLVESWPAGGADPGAIAVALQGLPFGLFAAEPSALVLLERLTGVQVEQAWLNAPQPAVILPPLP